MPAVTASATGTSGACQTDASAESGDRVGRGLGEVSAMSGIVVFGGFSGNEKPYDRAARQDGHHPHSGRVTS
jgi:hypothetical protein